MNDVQRAKLFRAESEVSLGTMTQTEVQDLVKEVCGALGAAPLTLIFADEDAKLKLYRDRLILPEWACAPLMVLHELAHHLTSAVFPAHGAEFARRYEDLIAAYAPELAADLEAAFDRNGVHRDSEVRRQRVRRQAVNVVNQEPGTLIELILDDPPECIVGPVYALDGNVLHVGSEIVDLDRGRYMNLVRS